VPQDLDASPQVELSFDLTRDDLIAYFDHAISTNAFYQAQMRRTRVLVLAVWVILALMVVIISRDPFIIATMFIILGGFALFSWVTWPKRWHAQVRKQSERQLAMEDPAVVYGPRRYEIDAESVRFFGPHSGGYVTWRALSRVSADERAIYLHLTQGQAHILPRSAFSGDAEFSSASARFSSSSATARSALQPEV